MASPEVTAALQAIDSASTSEKHHQYSSLLQSILANSSPNNMTENLSAFVKSLLAESLGVVALRPIIANFVEHFHNVKDPEAKVDVGKLAIELLGPKGAQYEEQDTHIKEIVADAYEQQDEYVKSAQTLQSISLDSTQKQLSADDKAKVWIRIVRCYLEEDDTTNAFTQLNKIKNVIHSVTDKETRLMFQLSQARIYDSQRAFLDAAQAYYTMSLETSVDEEERLRALSAGINCGYPGTRRATARQNARKIVQRRSRKPSRRFSHPREDLLRSFIISGGGLRLLPTSSNHIISRRRQMDQQCLTKLSWNTIFWAPRSCITTLA